MFESQQVFIIEKKYIHLNFMQLCEPIISIKKLATKLFFIINMSFKFKINITLLRHIQRLLI